MAVVLIIAVLIFSLLALAGSELELRVGWDVCPGFREAVSQRLWQVDLEGLHSVACGWKLIMLESSRFWPKTARLLFLELLLHQVQRDVCLAPRRLSVDVIAMHWLIHHDQRDVGDCGQIDELADEVGTIHTST